MLNNRIEVIIERKNTDLPLLIASVVNCGD